jgi:hypothetical protein
MIQLSLFPTRCFGILSPFGELASAGELPFTTPNRRRAEAAARSLQRAQPGKIKWRVRVVALEVHEAAPPNFKPTYVILDEATP